MTNTYLQGDYFGTIVRVIFFYKFDQFTRSSRMRLDYQKSLIVILDLALPLVDRLHALDNVHAGRQTILDEFSANETEAWLVSGI